MTTKRLFKWLQVYATEFHEWGNIHFYDEVDFPHQYKYVRATYKEFIISVRYEKSNLYFEIRLKENNLLVADQQYSLNDFRKEFKL